MVGRADGQYRPAGQSPSATGTASTGTGSGDEGGGESGTPEEGGDGEGGGVGERAGVKVSGRKGGERWRESRQAARLRAQRHTPTRTAETHNPHNPHNPRTTSHPHADCTRSEGACAFTADHRRRRLHAVAAAIAAAGAPALLLAAGGRA